MGAVLSNRVSIEEKTTEDSQLLNNYKYNGALTTKLSLSEIQTPPFIELLINGLEKDAEEAGPPSPERAADPVPAIVEITPRGDTKRMRWPQLICKGDTGERMRRYITYSTD